MRVKAIWLFGFLSCCMGLVWADTEIINFRLPLPHPSSVDAVTQSGGSAVSGPGAGNHAKVLVPSQPITFVLSSSVPSQAFEIDYEYEGRPRTVWTVRASWPGSHPARISISPPHTHGFTVRASVLTPRMPHPLLLYLPHSFQHFLRPVSSKSATYVDAPTANTKRDEALLHTPITLVLEPLVLGAVPLTAVPTVGVILLFALGSGLLVPHLIELIDRLVNDSVERDGRARRHAKIE